MRNDSNKFALALKRLDLRKNVGESVFVERSESLVEKKGVDFQLFSGHSRQGERERRADEKTFSAGKISDGTDLITLIVVDHIEIKRRILDADKLIPVGEATECPIRLRNELFEDQRLGKLLKLSAVLFADEFVQLFPALEFPTHGFEFLLCVSAPFPLGGIMLKFLCDRAGFLVQKPGLFPEFRRFGGAFLPRSIVPGTTLDKLRFKFGETL